MTPRKTPLTDRLTALRAAVTAAKDRLRAVEHEHAQVAAKIAAATDAIVEAHAIGDEATAARLGKDRAELEGATLREAEERLRVPALR